MLSLREKPKAHNRRKTLKLQALQKNIKYVVAIPTYNRSKIIAKKTLETLNRGGVPAKSVYIFVANDAERDAYANAVPSTLFKEIVVGVKGITDQRKFITRYFAEGTRVVSMDDDVEKFLRLSRNGEKLVDFKKGDLDRFIKKAFAKAEAHNLFLWGIYPMRYAYYMKHNVTTDLRLILGTAYGFICRHDADLVPTVGEKEDYENTIRHFLKDGGVMRFNDICLKTIYHSPGGLGKLTEERLQANKIAAEHLQQKYPDLVTTFKRPNGMTEVRLL